MADAGRHRLSVRARTTIAAFVATGLALALAAVGFLALVRGSLLSNLDDVAELRAADIAGLATRGDLPRSLPASAEDASLVQVVDARGDVVAASDALAGEPPVATFAGGVEPVSRTLDGVPGVARRVRVLALGATLPDGPGTIFVLSSLETVDETLGIVRTGLLVGAPVLLAAVTFLAWTIVGRALRPVESIRREVAGIGADDLGRRVPEPATGDEIARLSRTMNTMLDRLQSAAERQRRFVGDASHELQTPLAAIRAAIEVALAHPEVAPWTDTAISVLDEAGRMEKLVHDLLFLAKTDEGFPLARPLPLDLDDVVLAEAHRVAGGGGPAIDTAAVSAAPVRGRPDDLRRLVANLLDNARRYARNRVTVALHRDDGRAVLTVADDGDGVPAERRRDIFERFARLDEARDRGHGGVGLGLAIAREIAEQHEGTISIDDAPSGGARFTVELPADT